MIDNYFKVARRSLWRNKGFTVLNSIGLGAGVSIFTLVMLFINHEKSYDNWDKSLKKVYRIGISETSDGTRQNSPSVQYPLGTYLTKECPEVNTLTRIQPQSDERLISYGDKNFYNQRIITADSMFFYVFPYKFYKGNPRLALNKPQSVVITKAISDKIFGNEDPIGKFLKIDNKDTYVVSAVIEKRGPSHLNFEICLSNNSSNFAANWFMKSQDTYISLKPNSDPGSVITKAQQIYVNYNKLIQKGSNPQVFLEPVANIHLASEGQNLYSPANMPVYDFGTSKASLLGLFLIGLAILLLSCINYTNISIAKIGKRAKESGLRKVLGATKGQVIMQYLLETFIQATLATLFALIITLVLKNLVNSAFDLNLSLWNALNPKQNIVFFIEMVLVILAVTLLSGIYPALVLSGLAPVKVLKG